MNAKTSAAKKPSPAAEILGANLTFERARAKFSQSELAAAAKVTRQTISDIERCTANPTNEVVYRIAAALNISQSQLLAVHPPDGPINAAEIKRIRASPRSEYVDAKQFLDAVDEVAGRKPRGFSADRRPRLER